jgi:hypothetical protein
MFRERIANPLRWREETILTIFMAAMLAGTSVAR